MYVTGLAHVTFAILALSSGFAILMLRKGTLRHRRMGWVYAGSMFGLNGTALLIYRLFGAFGPFHVAALVSLITIVAGVIPVIFRRPRRKWMAHHAYWMTWSYVGLLAAAVSEVMTRVPATPFWWMVFASTFLVVGIGRHVINTRVPRALEAAKGR